MFGLCRIHEFEAGGKDKSVDGFEQVRVMSYRRATSPACRFSDHENYPDLIGTSTASIDPVYQQKESH
jgi:hypothetical protein